MKTLYVEPITDAPAVNLALDTIKIGKQALVFLGTRPSAEKAAEDIAKKISMAGKQDEIRKLGALAEDVLHAIGSPTRQCERLAGCIRKGIAFHHSGLVAKQRQLVEDSFRSGLIRIICSTPTLAAGIDMPAYRAIIRDLKRFSQHGYNWIPVLEYLQMAGRAGRPNYDAEGQAIILASSESHADELDEHFIQGNPEEIYSKLAVEPALRTYLLSIISAHLVSSRKEIMEFFSRTFWAHQFKDLAKLEAIINRMLKLLGTWEFITISGSDFVSAAEMNEDKVKPTLLGRRVAELYLDPLTGYGIISGLKTSSSRSLSEFTLLQLICYTAEMRPLLRVKAKNYDAVQEKLLLHHSSFLATMPSPFEPEYDDFLSSVKTAMFLSDWLDEATEESLLEKFDARPGETRTKLANADWLLYSAGELAHILRMRSAQTEIVKLRLRLKYGVREELLPLIQLKGIGRVRSRLLFRNKLRILADVKAADISTLTQILGSSKLALEIKKQLGEEVKEIPKGTRKGQTSIRKF